MTTFALIHGAYAGAWCFDLLAAELDARGMSSVAVDLPIEDPAAGLTEYADTVVEALGRDRNDDVVVVGHSMGGLVGPLVADRIDPAGLVFLSSPIPKPGKSLGERRQEEPSMMLDTLAGEVVEHEDGTRSVTVKGAMNAMFHDCAPEVADWATGKLRRQSRRSGIDRFSLDELPACRTGYIFCQQDRMISPEWAIERVPELLGITPGQLPGGHFPMLSRPAACAETLADWASSA